MHTIHLAVYDTLADWEYGYAAAGINNPEFQRTPGEFRIVTVAETSEPITTMGGIRIVPDLTLADVDPADSAMLILPGAQTWETQNTAFAEAARRWADAGVPVAAICGGTVGLARAGLLDDRAHTGNAAEELAATGYAGGDHYVDAAAVTDRGVITAGAIAPVDFAREIFGALDLYAPPVLDAWYRLYHDQDPSGFYALVESTGDESTDA
ncbi:type 1 glutamine amidotransferase family protein [Gordonia sinesedis]